MYILVAGLVLFIGVHLLREFGLRDPLLQRFGEGAYKGLYSLVALAGLGLIVWGKSSAPFIMVWQPVYELRSITHFLMLPAWILVVAGNVPMSHLRQHTVHPMLLGTVLWGGSHLWANGDLASALMFGSLSLWALFKYFALLRSKPASNARPSWLWDVFVVILGFSLYGVVMVYHGPLFGIGLSFE
ncbi:MAG: hypothetical protein RLZZ385_63 [Pseudomonadota bacterium]|jgi:uncharacterized membrane protein